MIKYLPIIRKHFIFKLAVTALASFVLYELAGFFLPLLLSVALAFALYPLVNIIEKIRMGHGMIRLSRVVAIILALLAFAAFIMFVLALLVLPLFGQMNELMARLPELTARSGVGSFEQMLEDPAHMPVLPSNFQMLLNDLVNMAMGFMGTALRNLFNSSLDIVRNLFGLIVVPFLTFYFLKDWRELRRMFIGMFSCGMQPRAAHVVDEIGRTLRNYVNGLGKLSLLAGFCIAVGTASLGVDYPMVLGFWAILAETVPVVGPLMGAVPAVFLAYEQSPGAAFDVALFYLVYYQLDANFIMPKIMQKKIDLHPVVVIVGLLIGAKLFGIIGMVFAVPVAAVYRVLYKELWHGDEAGREAALQEACGEERHG